MQQERYAVDKLADSLNGDGKPLKGSHVLVLGLAYRANIDDDRESPSYKILKLLRSRGALANYCYPFLPSARNGHRHHLSREAVPRMPECFARYDAVPIATAHDAAKDPELYCGVPLVVDKRNLLAPPLVRKVAGPRRLVRA
jgi:UDP-N-acetyl-D-glucosamine dehydrogenase